MFKHFAARSVMVGVLGFTGMAAACTGNSPAAPSQQAPAVEPTPVAGPAPAVTVVTPNIGSTGGGSSMQLTGEGMQLGLTVTFGDVKVFSQTGPRSGIFVETPAHAAGAVDLVVTNPGGQSQRLAEAYTFVSPQSLDLSGPWTGHSDDGSDRTMAFTVQDNKLVSASCSYDSTVALPLPSPPSVSNGEFSFVGSDGVSISGRIVSPSEVIGMMNFSVCTNMQWKTYPRSSQSATIR